MPRSRKFSKYSASDPSTTISPKLFGRLQPTLPLLARVTFFPFRTLIIFTFLTILLCVVLTVKLKKYAYFNSVNFGILFVSYIIYSLQLISFCIMNAQLFDKVVRAVLGTLLIYGISYAINPYIVVWPAAIQYILIFFSPFIGGYSLFQVRSVFSPATIE